MALNQLPPQLLMNSSVMFKIQRGLVKDLNVEFNKSRGADCRNSVQALSLEYLPTGLRTGLNTTL